MHTFNNNVSPVCVCVCAYLRMRVYVGVCGRVCGWVVGVGEF